MNQIKGGATLWARKTIESDIFYWKPDKWFKIWFYIVNRVNHKENRLFDRGECFIDYKEIMLKCKASRNTVKHCLQYLRKALMVTTRKTTRGIILSVSKYDHYQKLNNYYCDVRNGIKSPTKSPIEALQKPDKSPTINKNDKNVKNDKNIYISKKIKKTKTEIQQVVDHFFHLKGYSNKPIDVVKKNILYSRHVKSAKELISLAGGVNLSLERMDKLNTWAKLNNLDWNIGTVIKKWLDIPNLKIEKDKKCYYKDMPAYERNGKWFVIDKTGIHLEFAGDKKELIWK